MKKFAIVERPGVESTSACIMSLMYMFNPNENPRGFINFNMDIDELIACWKTKVTCTDEHIEILKNLLLNDEKYEKKYNKIKQLTPIFEIFKMML